MSVLPGLSVAPVILGQSSSSFLSAVPMPSPLPLLSKLYQKRAQSLPYRTILRSDLSSHLCDPE